MSLYKLSTYDKLKTIYELNFSLNYFGTDINDKFAIISLICYLTYKIKLKKPDITTYKIIRQLADVGTPDTLIDRLSIICEDFLYGCTNFPTFGLEDKQIPDKVKELLKNQVPF